MAIKSRTTSKAQALARALAVKPPPALSNKIVGALEATQTEALNEFIADKEKMSLPATYVDRVNLTFWKGHIRLTFGEQSIQDTVYWRTSILMEAEDVRAMVRRLSRLLTNMDKEFAEPGGSADED